MSDDALDVIERVSGDLYVSGNKPVGMALAEAHGQLLAEREAAAKDREDAERYREIARRWQNQKTSESELFLMTLGIDGDPTARLDAAIDAARSKP